jgi:hypothetical protein
MNRYVATDCSTEGHNKYVIKPKPIFPFVIPLCKIQKTSMIFQFTLLFKGQISYMSQISLRANIGANRRNIKYTKPATSCIQ